MSQQIKPKLRLECQICHWAPPDLVTMGVAQAHFQTEHDTDEVKFDLVPFCDCGETMDKIGERPTGGGIKIYYECSIDGNTGFIKQGK